MWTSARTWWRRSRSWRHVGLFALAGSAVTVLSKVWLPGPVAVVLGAAAATVSGVGLSLVTVGLQQRSQAAHDLGNAINASTRHGGLPRVRDVTDAVSVGVHPAEALYSGGTEDRVPPYVPRDADAEVRGAIQRGGFVMLVGESTAGKTRAAFEAVRLVLPDHMFACPADRDALASVLPLALESERCVVWLDDLERFLGPGGVTVPTLTRLLHGRSRCVVATMRSQELELYGDHEETGQLSADREVWRTGRDVVRQAHRVRLDRPWSDGEHERARAYTRDPRIARALGTRGAFGVAETLAAGPELALRWRNAWAPGLHPRAASLVAVAVDARRAGIHRPLTAALLRRLHQHHLNLRGGAALRPEPFADGLVWSQQPAHPNGASSMLIGDGEGRYWAFDYLVDLPELGPIPDGVWDGLLDAATDGETFDMGQTALASYQYDRAKTAFTRAFAAGIANADLALAETTARMGHPAEAADLNQAALVRRAALGADHPDLLAIRYNLASCLGLAGDPAGAVALLPELVADRARVLGPEHALTLTTRHALARFTGEAGDPSGAAAQLRDLLRDRVRVLGHDHHQTLTTRHALARFMGEAGDPAGAVVQLRVLLADRVRVLGPDHPHTFSARHNLARFIGQSGDPAEAVRQLASLLADQERIYGSDHLQTLTTRHALARFMGEAGDPAGAVVQLRVLLADRVRVLGPDHPHTFSARHNLARFIGQSGDPAEAARQLASLLADRSRVQGDRHPGTIRTQQELVIWQARQ
ncbi:tetratricopeptide repeat protein [Streptomyces fuscigenes]|uniref:tetratricopeptide repeat protein n=1 Tax=Streptomyces fuscigenes TaxID=1528880 RepID=UPI001F3D23D2|nr:tetratricopeptide repeat protein [Streptomyces fuscigenes]MCF3963919.1 tetratricopeptide repeat protein [Streptomyces fuscigenes]